MKSVCMMVAVALLSGCTSALKSGCSDEASIATLKQIFEEAATKNLPLDAAAPELIKARVNADFSVSIEAIRTSELDEKIHKASCDGEMAVQLPAVLSSSLTQNPFLSAIVQSSGAKVENGRLVRSIHYTVQPTDDGKNVYVQTSGTKEIAQVTGFLAASMQAKAEAEKQMPATPAPPPPSPTLVVAPSPALASPVVAADEATDPTCPGLDTSVTSNQLECLSIKYKAADVELNQTYTKVMAGLDGMRQAALRDEQRQWIKRRDKECAEGNPEFSEGSAGAIMAADCPVQKTSERVTYLRAYH